MRLYLISILIIPLLFSDLSEVNHKKVNYDLSKKIKHVETVYGGCNNRRNIDKGTEEEIEETCKQSIRNDTLSLYISINYICCAPFKTNVKTNNDTLFFYINDVCKDPYKTCYCRCHCMYTFDFRLINYEIKEYNYKVILNDPREELPMLIEEGIFDISELLTG